MGTTILREAYSLSSCPMNQDFHLDSTCKWPFFFEGMSNGFSSWMPQISFDECARKSLRQTILKQEEIFRKQVHELHRLYRVQRLCMEELKRKGEYLLPVKIHSSEMVSGLTERLGLWNGFPLTNAGRCRKVSPDVDHSLTHLFSQNSTRTGENTGPKAVNRSPRKVFDLHLPADAYMDEDDDHPDDADEKLIIKPKDSDQNHGVMPGTNILLDKDTTKDLTRGILADLNEPIEECNVDHEISLKVFGVHHQKLQNHGKTPELGSNFPAIQAECTAKDLTFRDVIRTFQSKINRQESSSTELSTLNFPQCNQCEPGTNKAVHSRSSSSSSQPKSTLESSATGSLQSPLKIPRDLDLNLEPSSASPNVTDKDEIQNSDIISYSSFTFSSSDLNGKNILRFDTDKNPEILAAEAIQLLSLSSRTDALRWFAEAVTSIAQGLESSAMDSFEEEALKLESIEIQQPSIERETTHPSPEMVRSPDLQAKRSRRRRRDFQREILPGLATLSRQEVSEDFQILTAMARVAGNPWKKSGRGRRKSPSEENTPLEEIRKERDILGWGRTTRRCCKQRSSSGCLASELVVAMDC